MAEDHEYRESLLRKEEEYYYPNCPGCKVERYKDLQKAFPVRDLFRIWVIVLATGNCFYISSYMVSLYSYIMDLTLAYQLGCVMLWFLSVSCYMSDSGIWYIISCTVYRHNLRITRKTKFQVRILPSQYYIYIYIYTSFWFWALLTHPYESDKF